MSFNRFGITYKDNLVYNYGVVVRVYAPGTVITQTYNRPEDNFVEICYNYPPSVGVGGYCTMRFFKKDLTPRWHNAPHI